jgi:hypothetical protein
VLFHEGRVSILHRRFQLVLKQAAAEAFCLLSRVYCSARQIAKIKLLDTCATRHSVHLCAIPWRYQLYLQETVQCLVCVDPAQRLNHWRVGHHQVADGQVLDSSGDDLERISWNAIVKAIGEILDLTSLYDLLELNRRLLRRCHVTLGC